MAPVGKENQQISVLFPKTPDKPRWKENTLLAAGTLSSSKIPVLSKSRHPAEWKQSQSQPCSSKARTCKMSHSNPVLELAAGLPPKTPTREPLSDMQLTTSKVNSAEFVSDLEALASILSNTGLTHQMVSAAHKPSLAQRVPLKGKRVCLTSIEIWISRATFTRTSCPHKGLSHSAFGATGKVSLAQRVPLKDARKPAVRCDSMQGEGPSLSQPRTSVMSAGKYGRVSCYTTPGTKGLEKLEASGTQQTNTPFGRCSNAEWSPYGLARRVPITNSQSLRRATWTRHRIPPTIRTTDKRVKLSDRVTAQMGSIGSKEEDAPVPWGKIAVRLFDEETAASVKKVAAVPAISKEMGKLQRIEYLAKLLQQEMDGDIDYEEAPSLKELHKHLTVHSPPTPGASEPELSSTLPQDPKPSLCEQAPDLNNVTVTPAPCFTHTTSSQMHICPSPSLQECDEYSRSRKTTVGSPPHCPLRFHEACLNDECLLHFSPCLLAQPSVHRCQEPVAKMLNAHDTMCPNSEDLQWDIQTG
ncbi:hypothetical protein E2320_016038 [Naja naja]|nr:hypothetical protein E2320_016038 [Naja naja]